MKMLDKPCCGLTGTARRRWRALLALVASALLLGGPARAAEPGQYIELLSGAGHADGTGWQASPDGVGGWIPAYAPYPNPTTMPNPRLNSLGVHGDLMWYWPGPGTPGAGSPPTAAHFRYMLDIPPGGLSQLIALVAADDEMTLKVNGTVIGNYRLSDHQQPNTQPIVVPMDLTAALHEGSNEILIDALDTGSYHWVFFDPYNIFAPSTQVLGPTFAGAASLIGDRDDYHGGDAVDTAPKSTHVQEILAVFAASMGEGPGADLDVAASNAPVGMTHSVGLPAGAIVTSAGVVARVKMTGDNVGNDIIYYNDSTAIVNGPSSNVVALFDLLGTEPQPGQTYLLNLNLAKLPLRASNPGATVFGPPDSVLSLLPMLQAQQHLDLVFADDTMVDFSELTVTYTMPGMPVGDLNGDGAVDSADVDIILTGLNTAASGASDPRDLDHDGRITILDVRKLVAGCSKPRCAR